MNVQEACVGTMLEPKRQKSVPKPTDLRISIMNAEEPFIMHNMLNSWDILSWSLDDWTRGIGDKKLQFRIGSFLCSKVR